MQAEAEKTGAQNAETAVCPRCGSESLIGDKSDNVPGVKGVGELGTIGATPATVNAVVDALARAGVDTRAHPVQMPVTSEQVWRALSGAH